MATSGSIDFAVTRNTIIEDALSELGIFREGADITSSEYTDTVTYSSRVLNRMVKAWLAHGMHLWTRSEGTVFFDQDTAEYSLNGSSGDEAANNSTVVETTISAAEASGQTVISVTSSAGMTAADVVLIEMDDGTVHSTTIVSVDSATQITITAATDDEAAAGNAVYTYTSLLERPLRIVDARLRDENGDDRVMTRLSHEEYQQIHQKTQEGTPTSYYYDPQLTTGKLYVWPRPDNMKERMKITYYRTIEDFDAAGNNPDFPIEWAEALVLGLAARLARTYGKDQKLISSLKFEADAALRMALDFDHDASSFMVYPEVN